MAKTKTIKINKKSLVVILFLTLSLVVGVLVLIGSMNFNMQKGAYYKTPMPTIIDEKVIQEILRQNKKNIKLSPRPEPTRAPEKF